jgi:hypothetical protein
LDGRADILGTITAETIGPACFGESHEIDGRQRAAIFRITNVLLLEFHFREAVVFQQDDFHRKVVGDGRRQPINIAKPPSPTMATDCRSG